MNEKKFYPIVDFVQKYMDDCEWRKRDEYTVYASPSKRFKIFVEDAGFSQSRGAIDCWRDDQLAEQGIYSACNDAKEFAQSLIATMFEHLSPHEMHHIVDAIDDALEKWRNEHDRDGGPICSAERNNNES